MTTNRISGPTSPEPDPGRLGASKIREGKQVEKVREIDSDEQAKKGKKFQKMLESAEEEVAPKRPRMPSPLEPEFHKTLGDIESKKAVPNPSYSLPPDVHAPMEEERPPTKLPKAKDFWNGVDLPDEPLKKPNLQEEEPLKAIPRSLPRTPEKQSQEPFVAEPRKTLEQARPIAKKEEGEAPPSGTFQEEKGLPVNRTRAKESARPERSSPEKTLAPGTPELEEKEERKRHKKEEKPPEIALPSSHPLPANVQAAALAAATFASPYLSPEVLPLFFQMIGSILVMASPPGIQRTVIVLNARSFSKSKFYGSTIEIEKYSTAPDSLNIRLSGTDEAVATFNQNLPSLLDAFENGNFNFRIGRLDAVYSRENFNEKRR